MERKTIKKTNRPKVDYGLLVCTAVLVVIGIVMLYSASTVESLERFGNTGHFLRSQLLQGVLIGSIALYICSRIDYHVWQKLLPVVVAGSLLLLALVKMPGVGFSAGGASRWIHLGPIFLQPAELAKLAVVIYAAAWLSSRKNHLHSFSNGILPMLVIVGLYAILILWQPDFGTMLALLGTVFVMIIASGVPWRWVLTMLGSGVALLFLLIKFEPYRAERLFTFLNPGHDPQGAGYQINQALMAVSSGGWFGLGYGQSRQKHHYLPEVLGDSVFAVVTEELGFIRSLGILAVFVFFFLRGFQIAANSADLFGKLLATGLTSMIVLQVVINVGAIIGLLPLTGIPLPFFSYGSSALIVNLCAVGILLNVSKQGRTT